MNKNFDPSKYYIFYDGDCGFCNYWVGWVLKRDKKDQFLFASLQSDFGQKFLKERNLNNTQFNTFYLWKPNQFYLIKSKAVMKVAEILGGKYALYSNLNFIPRLVSDFIYNKVAENRRKINFSRCRVPNEDEKNKFIA